MGGIIEGWKSVVTNLASEYNKSLEEFIPTQIKFLDTVKFNTDYCNELLKNNKEKIIEELNKMK
jgi:1-deoxy-D-xylulose 5-phosphate reductoisomerase